MQRTTSTATYDKAADLIRLEVVPGSNTLQPRPGQYYFLYQPFRLTGWESHPFTLGCWSYELGRNASTPGTPRSKSDERVDVSQIPLLSDDSSGTRSPDGRLQQTASASRELRLVFWIRPYDGWTRNLQQKCMKSPDQTTNATMLLEGPYGREFPLWSYDSVLLIAGGTGIASAVPYIQDHITRSDRFSSTAASTSPDEESSKTRIQKMSLVWVTRQPAFIDQLASTELSAALDRDDFRASFYATSPLARWQRGSSSSSSSSSTPGCGSGSGPCLGPPGPCVATDVDLPTLTDKDVDILQGRPNLEKIISVFAEEAHHADSSAAVLVCGPQKMADEARAAVCLAMQQGYGLRYVEESFTW